MRIRPLLMLVLILLLRMGLNGQPLSPKHGEWFHMESAHTAFPDSLRQHGHLYDSVLYESATHYQDSSVLVYLPRLPLTKQPDLVFWFHGWRNNIDQAINYYHLAEQMYASGKNAILILAETAKDAPDSYGGKLEQPGQFKALVGDILNELIKRKKINQGATAGNILLFGHSGAYRVIARILKNGGMNIQEVGLFDALYGETELFEEWLSANGKNRYINLYTDSGGTDEESIKMMTKLKTEGKSPGFREEPELQKQDFVTYPILFIHSKRAHNVIIFNPDRFQEMLEASPFLK